MGKRKRIPNPSDTQPPISSSPSSGTMPCSSGMELMSEEKPLHSVDSSELKTLASVLDITDGSMKLLNANPTTVNHHQSLGRSMFLKRSRHYYAHQYSRRNAANHANASTSRGKAASLRDERLSFKLATQCTPHTGYPPENMGKEIFRPDRLRSSSLVMDAASSDAVKMVCGFCQKPLRRRPYFLGSRLSSGELSVVAVLVCGHVYHAECLEQRTCLDDKRDPPCPLCLGSLSQDCDSGGHE
ncbi:uncharacterized protein LOC121253129 [Juglans microcarpa x Juglans regia]|uniref:uncharacterized protein LOC121253129 n=1 Tax=Juglans microcarpa x Juglans regia TaxID=2249226 RepID=UPI001B7E0570|nr:uncharacterized protein LOC121253129 [Juglans microcarpa x Juglans regia]XP_041008994.1 uncharacterized protein LOC121253129 [Juglans microcarpa x Juglans regia]XP_041008995.1 uncharacterized protein LOC121253129 [Juglans microcarpa x Juglans regia]